jgi:Carbohydrate binding domain
MPFYGNNFYSLATYGPTALVDFDASPIFAKSTNYGEITVTWTLPTGAWDSLILVRNTYGFPVTPDDGDLLLTSTTAVSYVDTGALPSNSGLAQGQNYYYTIFVRKTSDQTWYKAGVALGVSVKNYGTADLMYSYLPDIYKNSTGNSLFDLNSGTNDDLYGFLKVFAFEYDLLKTMAENAKHRYNALKVDGRMLPGLLNQFGFVYEKELGLQQARKIFQNMSAIYRRKGSLAGVKNFVTAFSGYNASILPMKNLMLSVDSSSFESSIDGWTASSNTTISRITGASETPAVSPYSESTAPSNFPNSQSGLMKAVATASGSIDFYCGLSNPVTKGVPVTAGLAYSLSLYGRTQASGSHTATITVQWYDMTGTFISTSSSGTGTINNTGWTRVSLANVVAPTNAYFAVLHVTVNALTAGEIHYFDAVQFERSTAVTNFVDARRIDILLNANRINWCTNPNFETNITNWYQSEVSVLSRNTSNAYVGTSSLALTSSGAGNSIAIFKGNPAVTPGGTYTVSAYIKSASISRTAYIQLDWYTSGNAFISSSAGNVFNTSTSSWTRVSAVTIAPATAAYAQITIKIPNTANAEVHYVDAVLLEQAAAANPYFDGTYGYYQSDDLLWENGTPNAGRSFYYKNRQTVTKRLTSVMPDYLPFGAPWALFVAQTP